MTFKQYRNMLNIIIDPIDMPSPVFCKHCPRQNTLKSTIESDHSANVIAMASTILIGLLLSSL